jgi:hypothetical protein
LTIFNNIKTFYLLKKLQKIDILLLFVILSFIQVLKLKIYYMQEGYSMEEDRSFNLISCRVCGVIMSRLARDICSKCFKIEEELFQKVKAYLRANPGATVVEVAVEVGCSEKQVSDFIRSGRLERIGAQVSHPCQICQKIIAEGIICQDCKKGLKEQVSDLRDKTGEEEPVEQKPAGPSSPEKTEGDSGQLDFGKKKGSGSGGHVGKRKG